MKSIDIKKWINLIEDEESMRILFYLREFNPNPTIRDLNRNLEIRQVKKKLDNLNDLGCIKEKDSKFILSEKGMLMMDGIYSDIKETAPAS